MENIISRNTVSSPFQTDNGKIAWDVVVGTIFLFISILGAAASIASLPFAVLGFVDMNITTALATMTFFAVIGTYWLLEI